MLTKQGEHGYGTCIRKERRGQSRSTLARPLTLASSEVLHYQKAKERHQKEQKYQLF
jgi:hypothetical protein